MNKRYGLFLPLLFVLVLFTISYRADAIAVNSYPTASPSAKVTPLVKASPSAKVTPSVKASPSVKVTPLIKASPSARVTPSAKVTPSATETDFTTLESALVPVSTPSITPVPTAVPAVALPPVKATSAPRLYNLCIVIMGDSRSCSLSSTLYSDSQWNCEYISVIGNNHDAIYTKDDTIVLICGEAGGYYANGAVERSFEKVTNYLSAKSQLQTALCYKYFNLFAVNGFLIGNDKGSDYINADVTFMKSLTKCDGFYQGNAGPIALDGYVYSPECNNTLIEQYNQGFKSGKGIELLDVYSYLTNYGFLAKYTDVDNTGVHYDSATDKKLINYILTVARTN